jgi:hypothetical protein
MKLDSRPQTLKEQTRERRTNLNLSCSAWNAQRIFGHFCIGFAKKQRLGHPGETKEAGMLSRPPCQSRLTLIQTAYKCTRKNSCVPVGLFV